MVARVDQISKVGNKSGKMTGTREQRPTFEGNKGTWTPTGRPSSDTSEIRTPLSYGQFT